jgi:hypothetical protein
MRWVGLVRNVMLGRDGLDRARLLDTVAQVGGSRVRSYLTTGNVTFDAGAKEVDDLSRRLEVELSRVVSRPAMVAIREHGWLRDLVTNDLFAGFDAEEFEFEVAFLRRAAPAIDPRSLPATGRTRLVAIFEREVASARPRSGPAVLMSTNYWRRHLVRWQPHEGGPPSAVSPRTPDVDRSSALRAVRSCR